MARERRIQFEGDDASYIRFLEARVLELEDTIQQSLPQSARLRRIVSPVSHGDSYRSNSMCGIGDNCTRQRIAGLEDSAERHQDAGTRLAFANRGKDQDIQERDNPCASTFEVIEYDPPRDTNPRSKIRKQGARSQSAERQHQVVSEFTRFMCDLPKTDAWKKWVSVDDSQRAELVRGLVEGFAPTDVLNALPRESPMSTELAILHEYGNSMKTSSATIQQLKRFRELIFCSLCAVALRSAQSNDDVYKAMREIFGSDASSKTLETLIRGAKWVNHTISLLTHTKWALRRWDTALLAARRISFYARFSDYSIKPEQVLKEYHDSFPEDTPDTSVPLAIPLIIRRVFRNSISLEDICKCLQYESSDIEPLQVLFDRIFQGPNKTKRRRRPEQAQSSKRQRRENSGALAADRTFQETSDQFLHHPTLRASFSEHTLQNLFEDVPSLSDSVPGQATSTFPQASEPTPQGDNLRTSDPLFSAYPNPQLGEPAKSGGDLGTSDAWFSTYSNLQAGDPTPQRDNLGTNDPLFSTYPNPQLAEPATPGDDLRTSNAWFSTYPNPQLAEPAASGDDLGTSDAWFSTYSNLQAGDPTPQRDNLGTNDPLFSTYPNPQLAEPATPGDDLGTSEAWFSTYSNPRLDKPARHGSDPSTSQIDYTAPESDDHQ